MQAGPFDLVASETTQNTIDEGFYCFFKVAYAQLGVPVLQISYWLPLLSNGRPRLDEHLFPIAMDRHIRPDIAAADGRERMGHAPINPLAFGLPAQSPPIACKPHREIICRQLRFATIRSREPILEQSQKAIVTPELQLGQRCAGYLVPVLASKPVTDGNLKLAHRTLHASRTPIRSGSSSGIG